MNGEGLSPNEENPIILEIFDALGPEMEAIYNDQAFQAAFESIEVDEFVKLFDNFTKDITTYNIFHRRERRLWAIKISRGGSPEQLEQNFINAIPDGKQAYVNAFKAVDEMTQMLIQSSFDKVLEQHLYPFTKTFSDDNHPFSQRILRYFREIGCSPTMIDEFRENFSIIDYDLLSVTDGGLTGIRSFTAEAVKAQVSILDFTAENGFSYLRGNCSPPKWAVTVSSILASAGIAIGAWVVVVIIASLLAILVGICVAAPRGSWVRRQCESLEVSLPIFSF